MRNIPTCFPQARLGQLSWNTLYVSLLINTVGVPKGLMMITRVWIFSPLHCFSPLNFSNCVLEIVSSSLPWGFQGQRQGACAVVRKMDRILSAYTEEDGLDDAKGDFFPLFCVEVIFVLEIKDGKLMADRYAKKE